jgi:Flp pilus assembly pilin Flp
MITHIECRNPADSWKRKPFAGGAPWAITLGRREDHPLDLETTRKEEPMELVRRLWNGEEGQDIAEYAVMLAVILVIVVGTIRLIGSNANNVFSNVASSIQ